MKQLSDLTNKSRFYILIGLMVLVSFAAYKLSFSATVEQFREYSEARLKLDSSAIAEKKLPNARGRLQQLEGIIGKQNRKTEEVQQELLGSIEKFSRKNDSKLFEVSPIHSYEKNGYTILTHSVSVKADFHTLQKLSKLLEDEFKYGHVAAFEYHVYKEKRNREKHLLSTYYVQNIQ
ncbi:hypothetical protein [Halocola ammonii]